MTALDLIGDILNWLAASVVFPLMFLPLAGLVFSDRINKLRNTFVWLVIYGAVLISGVLFVILAPRLFTAPSEDAIWTQSLTNNVIVLILAFVIFLSGGPQHIIERLTPLFEKITSGAGRAVMWLLLAMALVQFALVFLRYVFGVNFIYMQESITYMHGAVFLVAAGYALLTDDHVRVDIFYREAPPKRKALIDFLGTYLLLFPMCLLILWTASPYVGNSWAVREGSNESSGIQGVYLLKALIPLFAMLLAMAGFTIAARAGDILKGRG